MYSKDGENYFIVDSHIHYWDGGPANQRNRYGEGFTNCFYDYHRNLSPQDYVWPLEKFSNYSEQDLMHDLFQEGYVDVGVFQRLQHHRAERGARREASGPADRQRFVRPA